MEVIYYCHHVNMDNIMYTLHFVKRPFSNMTKKHYVWIFDWLPVTAQIKIIKGFNTELKSLHRFMAKYEVENYCLCI